MKVRRDGRVEEISARLLVPGDIIMLEAGNLVPADGRLLTCVNLKIEEAALTGESEAVEKLTTSCPVRICRLATGGTCPLWAQSYRMAVERPWLPPPA